MVNADLRRLTRIHREGSFNTQRSRKAHVRLIARHLAEAGFKRLKADNLKPKHVTALERESGRSVERTRIRQLARDVSLQGR